MSGAFLRLAGGGLGRPSLRHRRSAVPRPPPDVGSALCQLHESVLCSVHFLPVPTGGWTGVMVSASLPFVGTYQGEALLALADGTRRSVLELVAARPRSVGEIA